MLDVMLGKKVSKFLGCEVESAVGPDRFRFPARRGDDGLQAGDCCSGCVTGHCEGPHESTELIHEVDDILGLRVSRRRSDDNGVGIQQLHHIFRWFDGLETTKGWMVATFYHLTFVTGTDPVDHVSGVAGPPVLVTDEIDRLLRTRMAIVLVEVFEAKSLQVCR